MAFMEMGMKLRHRPGQGQSPRLRLFVAVFFYASPAGGAPANSRLRRLGVVDLDIVEPSIFTAAAEFDFGFGGMGDGRGFEESGGLGVAGGAQGVGDSFQR